MVWVFYMYRTVEKKPYKSYNIAMRLLYKKFSIQIEIEDIKWQKLLK